MKKRKNYKEYSIIMPAHNEEEFISIVLKAALGSHAQEIIVVDDCSTDQTAEIVRRHALQDSRVSLIQHSENKGYCAARRTGTEYAQASVLVFFDSDIRTAKAGMFDKLANPILQGKADYVVGDFENFGRVTEYLAKPLLKYFMPQLGGINQPLSGLVGMRRSFIFPEKMGDRYENLGVVLDAYFAGARFTEVNLGIIEHDKRPDTAKKDHANEACRIFFAKLAEQGLIHVYSNESYYSPFILGSSSVRFGVEENAH